MTERPSAGAFKAFVKKHAEPVEQALRDLLPLAAVPPTTLHEAMHYAMFPGGKRLRPMLTLLGCTATGGALATAMRPGAALECLHTYSLVHDDLPCMDNDDLRRGRPTCHKVYGDAMALLAGDALLTHAFGLIASPEAHGDPYVRCELISRLYAASGHGGMVGGQMMDLAFEGQDPPLPEITRLQRMKTAALITFCCEAGAIMGKSSARPLHVLSAYGQEVGLAYQIADDLLDMEGTEAQTGKGVRKDAKRGKATVVSVLGPERARAQADALAAQAIAHLEMFDDKADLLRAAARFAIERNA